MSHFYAAIDSSARRTMPTARGHKSTGISTYAASWNGRISVSLTHDEETGEDLFSVWMEPHLSRGPLEVLVSGIVGKADSVIYETKRAA